MSKKYLINCDGEVVSVMEYCKRKGLNFNAIACTKYRTKKSYEEVIAMYENGEIKYDNKKGSSKFKDKRLRRIWRGIVNRCNNPNCNAYKDYGGRGIKLSEEWSDYFKFEEDMYESYIEHVEKYGEKDTTIDRVNVDGNYCLENCRWATWEEQARNKRLSIRVDNNEPLKDYCEKNELEYDLIKDRLHRGYTLEEAENKPKRTNDSLIGTIVGDLLVLERIDYRYAKCKCLICGEEIEKRWEQLKKNYPTCNCRKGKKINIGENNYTYLELAGIYRFSYHTAFRYVNEDKYKDRLKDLENVTREEWLQMIIQVHKDEYFQKIAAEEKEREDKGNARIKFYYNKEYISLYKLAKLKNINYNKLVNIKYNTNKEYIDILKDEFNINVEYIDYKYVVK